MLVTPCSLELRYWKKSLNFQNPPLLQSPAGVSKLTDYPHFPTKLANFSGVPGWYCHHKFSKLLGHWVEYIRTPRLFLRPLTKSQLIEHSILEMAILCLLQNILFGIKYMSNGVYQVFVQLFVLSSFKLDRLGMRLGRNIDQRKNYTCPIWS